MATEQPQAADAPAAPSKPKLPMLIGMVAVGLAIGGGTGAAFIGPMVAKKMGKDPAALVAAAKAHDDEGGDGEHADEGGEESHAEEDGGKEKKEGEGEAAAVHLLENLVLNPAGSGGSRFLLLSVAIEVGEAAAAESLRSRDAELRDIILTALGTKSTEELTDISRRESFKEEVVVAIKGRFGKKSVKSLYFPQFVVQ
jgi:flagellar FliL protein